MSIKRKLAASLVAAAPVLAGCDTDTPTAPGLELSVHSLLGGLEPGEAYVLSGADAGFLPLVGGVNGAEYLIVPFYSAEADERIEIALRGDGVTASAPLLARADVAEDDRPPVFGPTLAVGTGPGLGRMVAASDRAHEELRIRMRRETMELMRRGGPRPLSLPRSITPRHANLALSDVSVGDLVTLNVQADLPCDNPVYRVGRVVAISERAIIVADTLNPEGGFTESHYQHFASEFDALVHPTVAGTFGEPSDIDGNGKVVMFFTSAVNDLTPPGSNGIVLGFFYARDLFARDGVNGCQGSNETEMFYLLVPDPERAVQEPIFSVEEVELLTMGVVAHEYQHLINASRRIYVNDAETLEEIWLDEALSHVAEELVFYEVTGLGPRGDINIDDLVVNVERLDATYRYILDNLVRYGIFLEEIDDASLFEYDLAGRGASWSFLRYLADRSGKTDDEFFYAVANARNSGLANLNRVLGGSASEMARDWAVSIYADNHVPGVPEEYRQPSWNFRSILPRITLFSGQFPLSDRSLGADRAMNLGLKGGGTAMIRVSVDQASRALLEATEHGGEELPASLMLTVLRTR